MVALRLCDGNREPFVDADSYLGIIELLPDASGTRTGADVDCIAAVMQHGWARPTFDAILATPSVRQEARFASVHHSTMQTRIDAVHETVGFGPVVGYGRLRLGVACLRHRPSTSRVLDLPTPLGAVPAPVGPIDATGAT